MKTVEHTHSSASKSNGMCICNLWLSTLHTLNVMKWIFWAIWWKDAFLITHRNFKSPTHPHTRACMACERKKNHEDHVRNCCQIYAGGFIQSVHLFNLSSSTYLYVRMDMAQFVVVAEKKIANLSFTLNCVRSDPK